MPEPLYTISNCVFSAPLQWSLTVFWQEPEETADWYPDLGNSLQNDGIRLLNHRFIDASTSQFAISTLPDVTPQLIVQRVKGRLGYLVRARKPKPFKRNFSVRSVGNTTCKTTEQYVQSQLSHHRMADPRVQQLLLQFQYTDDRIDLAKVQYTAHGTYWHNLHIVLVTAGRWCEVRLDVLQALHSMILRTAGKWDCRVSAFGMLPDHVHMVLGAPFAQSPGALAVSFLNNLAFVYGMKAMYQHGAYVGTVGEYTNKAM